MTPKSLALRHYERDDVVKRYGKRSALFPAEEALIENFGPQIVGKQVLDLGCGGGRTAPRLASIAGTYIGIDYAAPMVDICRERFPDLSFATGDATTLDGFDDASFDFVLFSYNGIDTMDHANRRRVFAAVKRVLVPGGWFAFSSHNRDFTHLVRGFDMRASMSLAGLRMNVRNLISFLKVRHLEQVTRDYAILSDPRAGYGQLSYFITKTAQVEQLLANGFSEVTVLDWQGRLVGNETRDQESMSLYYMCRNAPVERATC